MRALKNSIEFFLGLLFPDMCLGCRKEGFLLCGPCSSSLLRTLPSCIACKKFVPAQGNSPPGKTCRSCRKKTAVSVFFSPLRYREALVQDLIHQLKYRRTKEIAKILAGIILHRLRQFQIVFPPDATLLPIPLHHRKKRVRGFNQAELIAMELSRLLSLPTETELLKRVKATRSQTGLGFEERKNNLEGAFVITDRGRIQGKNFILLDDVKTTGATFNAAASVLKESGARKVWAVSAAQ
jgi:ComF family protein